MAKGSGGTGRSGRSGFVNSVSANLKYGFQRVTASFPVASLPGKAGGKEDFSTVKGEKIGDFIVHTTGGIGRSYQVTHLPTGAIVYSNRAGGVTRDQAKVAAKKLNSSNVNIGTSYESLMGKSYEQKMALLNKLTEITK